MIITCGPNGEPGRPSPFDRITIAGFQRMLERTAGRPQLDAFFNADQHTDNPTLANRSDHIIRNGQIEVAR